MFLLTQSTHRMVIQYHPRIGHLYVPNQRARIPNERGGSYVVTNGQGFRSDLEFKKERGDKPRILFFGDSFTAGDGVSNAERYAELVGAELGAEVYNYAVSGTGTDQQLLIMEQMAEGASADLIVLCVYVENIERIKVSYRESLDRFTRQKVLVPKPFFTLDGDVLNLHNDPVPLERPNAEEVDKGQYQSTDVITNPVREWIIKPLSKHKDHPAVRTAREVVRERMPWLLPAFVRRTGFQPHKDYASAETPGWRLMEAILRRFVGKAGSRPVLIVPIPSHYFYHDALDPIYQPLFSRLEDPGRGVHVADITRPLTQLSWADRKRIPFKYDAHFSPFGHRQVARHIADAIRDKGLWARAQASAQASVPAKVESAPARIETSAPTQERPRRPTYVLGLSCFYHDSAACLIKDGEIVAAAEEERFTRVKNDKRFPHFASNYCLEEAGIQQHDLSAVVYYDNAPLTFERLLHTLAAVGPEGRDSWERILPSWLRFKLHIPQLIRRELKYDGLVLHEGHHRSHAASAFYPSPFERAAIVTVDGVGEWATGSIGVGNGREVKLLKEMRFPNSLGLLYSAFTQFTGFKVNSGEYKMMGLAPYGEPKYVDIILDKLVDLKEDGSLELNM